MSLRDRAAAAADPTHTPALAPAGDAPDRPTIVSEPLPDVSYDSNPIADVERAPVHTAWARVMADVQSITKADRRDDVGGRYNFRGVDRVINAVGPALRRHGVLVLPTAILSVEYREARTSKGTVMQDCTVRVQWTVIGPAGDALPPMESAGQATDTQDKATSKAISVAQRVLFLAALHIPTNDPDVDRGHERGEQPQPKASDYVEEVADPRTSLGRLKQIRTELARHHLAGVVVTNEVGDEEQLGSMLTRIGKERQQEASGQ